MGSNTGSLFHSVKAYEKIILFSIVLVGFVFRIIVYTRYPYSYGIDGPYYNLQVRNILETGWLYRDDTPFVLYYFTLWSLILRDVTLGIKVGISILSSLIAVPTFVLVKRVSKDWRAGEIAAFLSLFHPIHMQLLDNLLKNAAGILFMLCFLCFFLKTSEDPRPRNYIVSFAFLLLTFLTHIHPSGLAILFVSFYILALWFVTKKPPRREVKASLVLFGSLAACLLVVFVSVPGALTKFSKVLSFVSSLEEETWDQAPFLGVGHVIFFLSVPLVLGVTYMIRDVWRERSGKEKLLFLSILAICLLLSLPLVPREWRWRFFMINFVPLALFAGYGLGKAEKDLPRVVTVGLVIVVLSSSFFETLLFAQRMGPIINEDGIMELERFKGMVPSKSVVVVHARVFYWVQLITGLTTFHGRQDPIQLYQEYGGPVYGLIEKGPFPAPPEIRRYTILDDGPFIIFLMYPR